MNRKDLKSPFEYFFAPSSQEFCGFPSEANGKNVGGGRGGDRRKNNYTRDRKRRAQRDRDIFKLRGRRGSKLFFTGLKQIEEEDTSSPKAKLDGLEKKVAKARDTAASTRPVLEKVVEDDTAAPAT